MMRIKLKRSWLIFLILTVFSVSAYAADNGVTFTTWTDAGGDTYAVKNLNGSRLSEGSKVQFLSSIAPPDPADPANLLHDPNGLFASGAVGSQNTGVQLNPRNGEFDYYFIKAPGTYYVRVWDTANPARGRNYNQASVAVAAPPNPPATLSVNLKTSYKADTPPAPGVKVNNDFALTYDGASGSYLPSFSLSAVPKNFPDGSGCQVNSYQIQVRSATDSWGGVNVETYSGQTASIRETDINNPYFIPGDTYYARANATNYFGTSSWGQEISFVIPASGAGAFLDEITINLRKKTDDFGINTISIPFAQTYDGQGNPVTNVAELVAVLNAVGDGYVSVVSLWDIDNQQEIAFTFNDKAAVIDKINTGEEPSGIALQRGRGYQLSVTGDKTITLKNYQ